MGRQMRQSSASPNLTAGFLIGPHASLWQIMVPEIWQPKAISFLLSLQSEKSKKDGGGIITFRRAESRYSDASTSQ